MDRTTGGAAAGLDRGLARLGALRPSRGTVEGPLFGERARGLRWAGCARCVLEADGVVFELWHDDWGFNTLVATTEGAETLVRKIGQDLERLLASSPR